ncbi:2,3-bisphosphoglycerate-dependent phosphoglycerate mutase [Amycolatopsis rubida]|uniref:2,3-bisphosphoglycerate-dependent phosphoglycerate mutase n=1 Tax=Amycolatopsis rubida TaxID=112413 RepID=A0ABX0C0E7_9PSEU|nr:MULTISPECIES: 2,3-bisphosphoglycerate-dependent phosphoglycerate mutase [Amycolatopsis]MYW96215.1 2,3-bisphosphoglycerate-dependent phosphoglycerate mutase [Amycolatopsis rubida]NEC61206.1 2,3-bisphosphoglycerate-dependent phosphoglycerate mutase [Amycolatopsis rubida]OAP24268.1 2,3-bisphosphoglycerate-dependent phosphoglycerate mutase [Amycolatopsis sp. M39]
MRRLILLRHGESVWNAADRFAGWTDVPLSEVGRKEAARAGALLASAGLLPDVVHTSLLRRAISTAAIALDVADRHWIPVRRTWRLNERHYGALEGRRREEVRAEFGDERFTAWRRSYSAAPPPLGRERDHDARYRGVDVPRSESLEDVLARLLPYWGTAVGTDLRASRTVLIVAHGNVLRALISHLDQVEPAAIRNIAVPTGEPIRYELTETLRPIGYRLPLRERLPQSSE